MIRSSAERSHGLFACRHRIHRPRQSVRNRRYVCASALVDRAAEQHRPVACRQQDADAWRRHHDDREAQGSTLRLKSRARPVARRTSADFIASRCAIARRAPIEQTVPRTGASSVRSRNAPATRWCAAAAIAACLGRVAQQADNLPGKRLVVAGLDEDPRAAILDDLRDGLDA